MCQCSFTYQILYLATYPRLLSSLCSFISFLLLFILLSLFVLGGPVVVCLPLGPRFATKGEVKPSVTCRKILRHVTEPYEYETVRRQNSAANSTQSFFCLATNVSAHNCRRPLVDESEIIRNQMLRTINQNVRGGRVALFAHPTRIKDIFFSFFFFVSFNVLFFFLFFFMFNLLVPILILHVLLRLPFILRSHILLTI
jgi:hypothetical protein